VEFARFDFGKSYFRDVSVLQLIKEKLPVSMSLGIWMTLLTYLISIPLGIRKAVQDGSKFDTWTSAVIIVGFAIPGFLFAILLIILFAGGSFFNVFPLRGLTSDGWAQFPWYWKIIDYFWHLTLPLISMALGAFATMTLLTKNSFLDEIRKQYVMTARAKGCSERQVLYNHIFRNAMLIVIAGFPGAFIHAFFSGSLLIETIFSLDGLGLLGFESVLNRDYPVVFGTLFIFSLVGLVINLSPTSPTCGSIRGSISRRVRSDDDHRTPAGRDHDAVAAGRGRSRDASCLRTIAAQQAPLAELQGQPPRLLVVLDLHDPVRGLAVCRTDRQRPAVPDQV
jgi:microcin C transport system permease protein